MDNWQSIICRPLKYWVVCSYRFLLMFYWTINCDEIVFLGTKKSGLYGIFCIMKRLTVLQKTSQTVGLLDYKPVRLLDISSPYITVSSAYNGTFSIQPWSMCGFIENLIPFKFWSNQVFPTWRDPFKIKGFLLLLFFHFDKSLNNNRFIIKIHFFAR